MVVLSALHGDSAAAAAAAAAAVPDELFGAGVDLDLDLETFFDHVALEVPAARGGHGKDEDEELEWLSNKDAFPTVETMLPAAPWPPTDGARRPRPVVVKKKKAAAAARRCRHCGTGETPQWREGPEGRATLCNACGIWYRRGRLVPEYRPASSPSFSRELHSNCHRSIVKMRRLREEAAMSSPTAAAGDKGKQG